MLVVSSLGGLWTRSLIRWPDGAQDTTTVVRWLQGVRAYIDLRQPAGLPDCGHAAGLDELRMEDCVALAAQEGFAGSFGFDGAHFEWARAIDYQPKPLYSDAGALWWEGDVLVEKGRDIDYIEHWHRESDISSPSAALFLSCAESGVAARLVRVGRYFMYARDRAVTPPAQLRLAACVAGAADVAAARALVDCEISFGVVGPGGFRIQASTLPYRVGDMMDQVFNAGCLMIRDRAASGKAYLRRWRINEIEGDAAMAAAA